MRLSCTSAFLVFALTTSSFAQAPDKTTNARVTELKSAIAANRARLAKYQWTEITTVLLKGEVKKEETSLCHYGPDGQIVKSPLGASPVQAQKPGGLRGKLAGKKIEELQDYGQRLRSLVGKYIPPSRDRIQSAFQAGTVTVAPGDETSMTVANYYKPGDKVIFAFDRAAKKITHLEVNTYLDDPKSDVVTLIVNFATLDDGTNYAANTDLKSASKNMEIKIANSNYAKMDH